MNSEADCLGLGAGLVLELSAQTFYQTPEEQEGLPKNSPSVSMLLAVQHLAALLLPCPEPPAPAQGEGGGTCFSSPEKKGTWWLGEKVYSISTMTNKQLVEGQPQQRQLAHPHRCWQQLHNRCSRKHNPRQPARRGGTLGAAGSAGGKRGAAGGAAGRTAASLLWRQC